MGRMKWSGSEPKTCDICRRPITSTFVDGRTRMGPWAIMCMSCFKMYGSDLGIGKGQKYRRTIKGEWEKC